MDLTEEGEALLLAQEEGLQYLNLPVEDMCAPEVDTMKQCVAFVDQTLLAGSAVAVHCRAGYGRPGTMLAAYLVSQGHPAGDAMALVRLLRPGSIETVEQEQAVKRYAADVQSATS